MLQRQAAQAGAAIDTALTGSAAVFRGDAATARVLLERARPAESGPDGR